MKKSKIIIPALALMAFSVAASITGTVAWFTANRVATVTAGSFAVVNTTSNLEVHLANGIGTTVNDTTKAVTVNSGYKLTDGSLDHASVAHNIVAPDESGSIVGSSIALASATGDLSDSAPGNMLRDYAGKVYTAFTWKMTFKVSFASSASLDAGLFLDISDSATYMHEKVHLAQNDAIPADTYYATEDCTGDKLGAGTVTDANGKDVFLPAPSKTGKAFRIAFIPTAIGGTGEQTSVAYSKVWAKNEDSSNCGFVDTGANPFVVGTTPLAKASYGASTSKISGHDNTAVTEAATLASGMVLMDSAKTDGIPTNNTMTQSQVESGKSNYLGTFKVDAGKYVEIEYTCVAWFDGTDVDTDHGSIVSSATDFETIVSSMKFGVSNLKASS